MPALIVSLTHSSEITFNAERVTGLSEFGRQPHTARQLERVNGQPNGYSIEVGLEQPARPVASVDEAHHDPTLPLV